MSQSQSQSQSSPFPMGQGNKLEARMIDNKIPKTDKEMIMALATMTKRFPYWGNLELCKD